jgi:hypothetical protein
MNREKRIMRSRKKRRRESEKKVITVGTRTE